MFFWGPIIGPGVVKKKGWLLRYEIKNLFATVDLIFSFIDLEPDGCLVADQFRIRTKTFEITGAVNEKGLIQLWMMSLQKKLYFFAMVKCFLLTGAF